jgi:dGTPase
LPRDLDGLALWDRVKESVGWDGREFTDLWRHRLIRRLIGLEVGDVIQATDQRLVAAGIKTIADLQALDHNVIGFSAEFKQINRGLKDFLYSRMYRHYRVTRMQTMPIGC